jgi:hypothetical protein
MADPKTIAPLTDLSKTNPYGMAPEQISDLQDTLNQQINALEQRYAQPNLFKIAAGFLKPQLGGFSASLGSASEAMGENVEQQRAMALPLAQMRTQLAQSNILLDQNSTQAKEFANWQATKKPMDQATYARIAALNPNSSVAAAAKAAYEGGSKDIENTRAQQRAILDTIQLKQAKGMPLSKPENDFLQNFATGLIGAPEAARASNIASPNLDSNQKPEVGKQEVGVAPTKTGAEAPEKAGPAYPLTFEFPDVSNMSDPERKSRELAYQRNAESAEKKSEDQVQQLRAVAADPVFSAINSEYTSAIDLLKTQPVVAKKVFNLLRQDGSLMNQIMSAAQSGFGVNLGSMAANINLPVEAFARAGLNEEQQLMADRLVRAMLVVGNAKLASQGITPEKGQDAYKQYLDNTKASLQQNPATALHNLQKDFVTFAQSKKLYDQVTKEHRNQQKYSPTPYTDVFNNSPEIMRINEKARQEMMGHEADYQSAIRQRAQQRANQGR